ncbi:MAG: prepilin-type N-terminal cleavage/methylation domain-containing protein [Shewanella xiamenensis]|jgi:prepilin-type N-terminal cleavage/methylation domain-containing protein|uniref:Prepilin-type N-terminal cleavage/methylation domain-containing protein n=1 Tax=Shewanella xiamenensis TaxID=332186 RepID=A0AAE4Q2A6_9GAMM|nr:MULTISPECIES: prepilin-type N-terminal cleavage/methylation domain-containing protein [Shewanella]MCD8549891.1 prepilin-type N-terminal cleavage/methylation domain-containing protein [Shewanella xiamenensis]MCD8557462.1 prepilin-type N-terminal cleavage/methylation domain-containing protein [Shewanella xiamenensis]MCT8858094.1 prepilin-type N-terminal cleavage/methylation domain-containing protein [Shewanella xiamenensis]MDH0451016.1 prepilin-type N-terminal cleavage/methylation domain-conta
MKYNLGSKKNKQKGIALVELITALVIIGVIAAAAAALIPKVQFMQQKHQIGQAVDAIATDALTFRGMRPSYPSTISISNLCADGLLNTSICGTAKTGVGANPFGGDWTLTTSTKLGAGHITIGLTNIPDERFQELADTLAARSKGACTRADSTCPTITQTAPTTNAAGGVIKIDI